MKQTRQNVLCFDFGLVHIGVAITDLETCIVHPLTTIDYRNKQTAHKQIDELIHQWNPLEIIVGQPSDESPQTMLRGIKQFINHLAKHSIPVSKMDEAYSSYEAKNLLKQQRNAHFRSTIKKGEVDKIAACLILESWIINTQWKYK